MYRLVDVALSMSDEMSQYSFNEYIIKFHFLAGFILFLSFFVFGNALKTINSHLDGDDRLRLNAVFQDGLKSIDLQSIYYSSLNLKDLSKEQKAEACSRINTLYFESKLNVSLNIIYFHYKKIE